MIHFVFQNVVCALNINVFIIYKTNQHSKSCRVYNHCTWHRITYVHAKAWHQSHWVSAYNSELLHTHYIIKTDSKHTISLHVKSDILSQSSWTKEHIGNCIASSMTAYIQTPRCHQYTMTHIQCIASWHYTHTRQCNVSVYSAITEY